MYIYLQKQIYEDRKSAIQGAIRDQMGLLVDVVKQGHGSTNDGNTARKFFASPSKVAAITGLDEGLLIMLRAILAVVSSTRQVDQEKFVEYCSKAKDHYEEVYPWGRMNVTLHKLLVHGPLIVSRSPLPVGMLSEEPSEAANKFLKRFAIDHARQISRTTRNEDVLKRYTLFILIHYC